MLEWFAPLSVPARLGGLPTHQQQALAFVQPGPFRSDDVSFANVNQIVPYSRALLYQSIADPVPVTATETITVDKWLVPLSTPVIKRVLPTSQHPSFTIGLSDTATDHRWQQPLSEPVRRGGQGAHLQPAAVFVGSDTARDARWFTALSEPTRAKPIVQPDGLSWAYYTPAATETITVDKWFAEFAQPAFPRGLAVAEQPALSLVSASPFAEAVSIDKWQQPLSVPTRRIGFAEHPAWFYGYWFPPQPDITVEKWYAPLALPVRLQLLATASQPALAWVPIEIAAPPTPPVEPRPPAPDAGGAGAPVKRAGLYKAENYGRAFDRIARDRQREQEQDRAAQSAQAQQEIAAAEVAAQTAIVLAEANAALAADIGAAGEQVTAALRAELAAEIAQLEEIQRQDDEAIIIAFLLSD